MVNVDWLKQKEDGWSQKREGEESVQEVTWLCEELGKEGKGYFLKYFKTRNRGYSWEGQKESGSKSGENKD